MRGRHRPWARAVQDHRRNRVAGRQARQEVASSSDTGQLEEL